MQSYRALRLAAVASALFLASQPVSFADDAIDEIVVSAAFRDSPAREVAASVTVLQAADIEQLAVQHFEELVSAVPNLNWSGDGHRARYFQIRGAGELEQYQGAPNPSVGFLVDDIDFSGIGTIATLFDLRQVDVLRGPQGTRYGANALAGLIYLQSTLPTKETGGRLQLMAGGNDAWSVGLAAGGSLNADDSLLYRASAHHYGSNGFRHNSYLGRDDTNARDETTIRGRLRWLAGKDWQVDLAALFADIDDGYDAFALDSGFTMLSDHPGRDAQRSVGTSVRAEYSGWDAATLTSISGYADSDIDFDFDADWGNAESWAPVTYDYVSLSTRRRSTLSQELRLASDDWLLGLYAMRLEDTLATLNRGEYYDPGNDIADSLDERFDSRYRATNVAVFGEFGHDIAATTRVTLGLRGERRTTDYADSAGLRAAPAESMFGGELALRHELSAAVSTYLSLSRGYKAGGFNLGVVPDDRREFGAEALWNLEAGVKSVLAGGALRIDAAIFLARRDDQQVRTSFQLVPGDPASFVFFTDNAASGSTQGVEADLHWLPNEAWSAYLALGLLDARFDRFETPQVDLDGRRQAHAPPYSVALGGQYRHSNGFFARLDLSARGAFYFDVSHDQKSRPSQLVNARIGVDSGAWSLQAWVRNLFEQRYAVRGFYFGNEPPDFPDMLYTRPGDPRQFGVTYDRRF
jgi:iron complex outermembrane recepter protein